MSFKKQIRILFSMALGLFALTAVAATAQAAPLTSSESSILGEVNAVRAAHGLSLLRVDTALTRAADAHTAMLMRTGAFTHGSFVSRLDRYGARGPRFGENLAWGVGSRASARAIVRAWLASPRHRANLLRPGFRRVGIGAGVGSFFGYGGAIVVTADFAGS